MNLNPAELLNPVFNTLDSLIENDGVYLYLVFVWLALLAIAWIFSGGLRKRMKGNSATVIPGNHLHDATADAIPAANHRHRG
jgi:hypothetical protein